jgi:hypothetical protein
MGFPQMRQVGDDATDPVFGKLEGHEPQHSAVRPEGYSVGRA